jgi:hypothetical protein
LKLLQSDPNEVKGCCQKTEKYKDDCALFFGSKTEAVSVLILYYFCDGMKVIQGFLLASIAVGT